MMKAATLHTPGPAEALKLETRPIPVPKKGEVLIKVHAFGLNRSELFTRQGHSPKTSVTLPRVLGIEAVGTIVDAPGGEFTYGQNAATAMGGMGRLFDGGYAEFVCVPVSQVQVFKSSLPWDVLGALPEMLQTAWGSLFVALRARSDDTLLIRGGTTSIGLAAAAIAKNLGIKVIATTRKKSSAAFLLENGADHVLIDNGEIAPKLKELRPNGVERVLELVGTTTLIDSLHCAAIGGSVCMTGMVGNKWEIEHFSPMGSIPMAVNLTTYSGGTREFMETPLQKLIDQIEEGTLKSKIGKVFKLDQIVEAHRCMENNEAGGKIVVLT